MRTGVCYCWALLHFKKVQLHSWNWSTSTCTCRCMTVYGGGHKVTQPPQTYDYDLKMSWLFRMATSLKNLVAFLRRWDERGWCVWAWRPQIQSLCQFFWQTSHHPLIMCHYSAANLHFFCLDNNTLISLADVTRQSWMIPIKGHSSCCAWLGGGSKL